MKELSLKEVTRENWRATLCLAVFPEQQRYIADYVPIAAIALAKAYIRPGDLFGCLTHFMPMGRWWDLPNSHMSQGAWMTTGSSTSLSITTTRDEDMEKKRSASCFSSSGTIILSVWHFNSPSIQKMITHSTSTQVLGFDQRKQSSAANRYIDLPRNLKGDERTLVGRRFLHLRTCRRTNFDVLLVYFSL